jgi:hypothetical protein
MDENIKPVKSNHSLIFLNNNPTYEVTGTNNTSIHPDSSITIADIIVDCSGFKKEPENLDFYIAISTPNGQWSPSSMWYKRNKEIEYDTGHITRKIYKVVNVTS